MKESVNFRIRKPESVDEEGSWAISYGDMITVLLAFFVMFFSVDFKKEKEEVINTSLIESLLSEDASQKITFGNKEVIEGLEQENAIEVKQLDKDNILVFYRGKSFFASGGTWIFPKELPVLKDFSNRVMPFLGEYKIVIQAYTDSTPVSPGRRYRDNTELAVLRSVAIMRALLSEGVDSDRIEVTGKGVLNTQILKLMNIDLSDDKTIKSMQRTVSFVLRRSPIK
jgi:chemotaxis protein MotB